MKKYKVTVDMPASNVAVIDSFSLTRVGRFVLDNDIKRRLMMFVTRPAEGMCTATFAIDLNPEDWMLIRIMGYDLVEY